MYDIPSFTENLVPLDRDIDPSVFRSQESVMTSGSLHNEFMSLAEDNGSFSTSRIVAPDTDVGHSKQKSADSAFTNFMMEHIPPQDAILMDLPGFAHLQSPKHSPSSSSGSESDDSSATPENHDPLIGMVFADANDTSDDFEPLPGFGELKNDWANEQHHEEDSTELLASLAGCGIVPEAVSKVEVISHIKAVQQDPPPVVASQPKTKSAPKAVPIKPKRTTTKRRKRNRPDHNPAPSERHYVKLNEDHDVAMGRGGKTNKLPGNLRYHAEKRELQAAYHAATKEERTDIAQQLVDGVHARGGRFCKEEGETGRWYIASNHQARTKAGQALRETYTPEERAEKRQKYRAKKKAKKQQKEDYDLMLMMDLEQ